MYDTLEIAAGIFIGVLAVQTVNVVIAKVALSRREAQLAKPKRRTPGRTAAHDAAARRGNKARTAAARKVTKKGATNVRRTRG